MVLPFGSDEGHGLIPIKPVTFIVSLAWLIRILL